MLGAQRRLWLTRLRWQRRDALRLAPTQLGPMLCCTLRGNAGKVKWRVRGGGDTNRALIVSNGRPRLWTKTCLWGHAGENEAANTNRKSLQLLETSNTKTREKVLRDSVWVGGLRGPMQNLCIKLLKKELLTPAKKILDQNSFNACLVFFPPLSSFISRGSSWKVLLDISAAKLPFTTVLKTCQLPLHSRLI